MPFVNKKFEEIKREGLPLLREIGSSVIKVSSKLAKDVIKGKNIKQSAKRRFNQFEEKMNELSETAGKMDGYGFSSNYNTTINR